MKITYIVISLMILVNLIFAQYPETIHHYSIVNATDLGRNILLFIPDTTTQILINPARAAAYDKSFIYTNYNYSTSSLLTSSDLYKETTYITEELIISSGDIELIRRRPVNISAYSSNYYSSGSSVPDFSIVSLFNAFESKWLFNLSHDMYHYKRDSNTDEEEFYTYDLDNYKSYSMGSQSNERKSDESKTEIILSKIGISRLGNYSIGLFGAYTHDYENSNSNYNSSSQLRDFSSYTNRVLKYTSHRSNKRLTDIENYQIGISYSLSSGKSDFMGRIAYHYSEILDQDFDHDIVTRQDSVTSDTIPEYLSTRDIRIVEDINFENNYSPGSYLYENYFQRNIVLLNENDHIFIKLNGFYSTDQKSFKYEGRILHDYNQYNNDIGYSSEIDTITLNEYGKEKLDNWGFTVSIGYISSFQLDDMFVLTGINPYFQLVHLEDINSGANLIEDLNELKTLSLKLPVYIAYSPQKWIEIYGGLNYLYSYSLSERDYEYIAQRKLTNDPDRILEETRKASTSYESVLTSRSSYLGVNLKHKSGLRCMINFRSDILSYKSWNISLGYHF